ncbi:MAG TPA: Ig-like domain-containing protein [Firmicutes bacterium]|nr:Ig-like domain-containing protein [Bacillota bacterium]
MKKKRICMALAAALSLSLAVSATALAAIPSDIGGHWAQGTIIQWTTNGYISGYPDGTFKPDNSITRAEFVVMVNKAMGYNKRGNAYFSDVSAAHWAYAEIMKGVEAGYITGNGDGTFRPDAPVTRQEAAVMISKILGLDQDYASAAKYVDYRYIPSWAAGYVGAVSKAGIMTGYPDGDFKSDRVLTRAESVVSLDKTKNYDGKVEEDKDDREVFEDYRLTSSSLSDKIIKGDLIISSSLSNRNVSLDNVKVEGKLIVEGGKTVTADGCEISELEMNRSDVEFDATGRTKVGKTTFEKYGKLSGSGYSRVIIDEEFSSYIELDANIDYVELDADTNVRLLENCVIETFEATKNADNATVNFNKAEVEDMDIYDAIRITGRGDINNMTVYKSGVKSSIRPDHLDRRNGASKPDYTSTSSGDVGYNPGSRYDDLTVSRNNKIYKGGRYDDVKVTADERVTLKDMTIYGDLTIDEDVEDGDVYLDDLDIRGHVYIYGGGESTVSFKDCEIEGNIYAKKDYKDMPVGLYIDGDTVENFDGTLVIEKNGAIVKGAGKLDNVNVLTKSKVEIDTDVKNLYVNAKTDNLTITSGTTVDKLSISSSSAKDSTIKLDGNVKEISTNYDITVTGSGDYDKKTGSGTINGKEETIAVTEVTLNKTALTLTEGASEKLKATVKPDNATNKELKWSSSDTSIATVDNTGKVLGMSAGNAVITVTTKDGSKTATCNVTVITPDVSVESVGLNTNSLRLSIGEPGQLTAIVNPSNATNKEVTWSSLDPSVATVDDTGKVLGMSAGNAVITVTTKDGSKTATCDVEVIAPVVNVESIGINLTELSLSPGEASQLTATVNPINATNKKVNWSSSNPTVATVDSTGKVLGLTAGGATITAETEDGARKITCNVTVKPLDTVINKSTSLSPGEGIQLGVSDVTNEAVISWSVANGVIAKVNETGYAVGLTSGTTTITATTTSGLKVIWTVTVI